MTSVPIMFTPEGGEVRVPTILGFKLDQRDVLVIETLVTHPLGVHFLSEKCVGTVRETCAHSVGKQRRRDFC